MEEEPVYLPLVTDGEMADDNEKSLINKSKRSNEWIVDGASELESPNKKLVKEISNDESSSEVLDPHVSPKENALSSQTVSSESSDAVNLLLRSKCGDTVPSTSTGNSSAQVRDTEERSRNDLSTSEVVIEAPKSSNSSGVRRIIFKFTRVKEVNNGVSSSTSRHIDLEANKGSSKKVLLDSNLSSVKKLLATRILDGAKVKYRKLENEILVGIISAGGYLCGCVECNFTKVLNAFEFEQHSGCTTKHPNNHIFLDNGKSVYSIVEELRGTPLNSLDQVIQPVAGSSVNVDSYLVWKGSFESANHQRTVQGGIEKCSQLDLLEVPQSETSCPSEAKEDILCRTSSSLVWKFSVRQENYTVQVTSKEQSLLPKKSNTPCQLYRLNTSASNSVVQRKKPTKVRGKKRDNDLHRLVFMPNGLRDGAKLAYYAKGQRLLGGSKQGNGIVCDCCKCEISPSQFEAHAGWATRRQPYRHIYTEHGVSLHDLSLALADGQSVATTGGGDTCVVCGEHGDLMVCDGCTRLFHSGCLEEGDLYCPYCKASSGIDGNESCDGGGPSTTRLTRVVKAPATIIGGCAVCRAHDFSVAKFDDRTVMLCDQCEKEYHVGCLKDRGLCYLKELPKGKWFCCEDCRRIHAALQNLTFTGAQVIPASLSNSINKKLTGKGLFEEVGDVRWQLLSGKTGLSQHRPLLSRAAAIFRGCFDPIVERSGRDLIPAMVYGRNLAGLEFGGMYCAVLSIKSVIVSAGIVRIFGKEAAEIPLVATIKGRQGMGCFQALFSCIERFLCDLKVENLVLPAAEEAISIWTNKFGFRQMTDDRFYEYTKDYQLMTFKGTSMLEKVVPWMTEEQSEQSALVTS